MRAGYPICGKPRTDYTVEWVEIKGRLKANLPQGTLCGRLKAASQGKTEG
jgi:hypothetical protein